MRASVRLELPLAVVVAVAILGSVDSAAANDVIADGGFESASLHETSGNARTYDGWAANAARPGSTIALVNSPVLSGSQAVQIDTRSAENGRFIYQDLRDATGCFTWTFHVYPGQGRHVAELLYSLRGDNGPLKGITVLDYGDNGIAFTGWDASTSVAQVLSPDQWHEVTVKADAITRTQKLLVDGSQLAELKATNADAFPDTMIIGDVAGSAFKSLYTYDDVSLQTEACADTPTPVQTAAPAPTVPLLTAPPASTLPTTTSGQRLAPTPTSGVLGTPTASPVGGSASATATSGRAETATSRTSPTPTPSVLIGSTAPQDSGTSGSIIGGSNGNNGRPEFARSVRTPGDLSGSLTVIGTNASMAAVTLILIILSAELFNKTVEENHGTLSRWFKPIFGPLESFFARIGDNRNSTSGESLLGKIGPPIAVLAVSGLIYGVLEPGFGFNEKSLVMLLSVIITVGIVTYFYNGGQLIVSSRLFSLGGAIHLFPVALLIAAACVLATRLDGFQPGIIYGFIASAVLLGEVEPNIEQQGRTVFYPTLALLGLCLLSWLLISPFRHLATNHNNLWAALPESIAVGVFVGGLEGTFFQMIPIRYLDGHTVWNWNKLAWVLLAGSAAFMFWEILLNDQSGSATTVTHGTPAVAIVAMSICCILSLGFYAFFRLRGEAEMTELA